MAPDPVRGAGVQRVGDAGATGAVRDFYVDDALVASRDPATLQRAVDVLVALFKRVGLRTNTKKTKVCTFVPGKIRTRLSTAAYARRVEGKERRKNWESRRVECHKCGANLAASSLREHLRTQHDIHQVVELPEEYLEQRPARTYWAGWSADGKHLCCPVPGCGGKAASHWNMRRHFRDRHPLDLVGNPGEGVLPRCQVCRMQTSPSATGHRATSFCVEGGRRHRQHEAAAAAALALRQQFSAYGEVLERVEVFRYLGRLVSMDDEDAQAIGANIKKARRAWAQLHKVLRGENAEPGTCASFYRATVQAVLLFASETWNLTPSALKKLEGFHTRCAWRMNRTNVPRKGHGGAWEYPSVEASLKEAGLATVEDYVRRRRSTIARWIVDRPIYEACKEGERRRGTSACRQWWWEQPMGLESVEELFDDQVA